jgi:uncharacterized RDD family membrane protein YckC
MRCCLSNFESKIEIYSYISKKISNMETETLDDNNYSKIRNVQYANFGARFGAALLDFFIIIIPLGALMYFGYANRNVMLLLMGTVMGMLYKPVMEGVWSATLGKMIVGITMVDADMQKLDLTQSFLKNGIYIISSLISLLSMIWVGGQDAFKESEGFMEALTAGQGNPYEMISMGWSVLILVSCFAMLGSSLKQTLHDRLANTFCVNNSTFDQV